MTICLQSLGNHALHFENCVILLEVLIMNIFSPLQVCLIQNSIATFTMSKQSLWFANIFLCQEPLNYIEDSPSTISISRCYWDRLYEFTKLTAVSTKVFTSSTELIVYFANVRVARIFEHIYAVGLDLP